MSDSRLAPRPGESPVSGTAPSFESPHENKETALSRSIAAPSFALRAVLGRDTAPSRCNRPARNGGRSHASTSPRERKTPLRSASLRLPDSVLRSPPCCPDAGARHFHQENEKCTALLSPPCPVPVR